MALELKWTKTADRDLYTMVEFLETSSSPSKLPLFLDQVFLTLELLLEFPEMGILESAEKAIRSYRITQNCRVFYRIETPYLVLLAFLDPRSNRKFPN